LRWPQQQSLHVPVAERLKKCAQKAVLRDHVTAESLRVPVGEDGEHAFLGAHVTRGECFAEHAFVQGRDFCYRRSASPEESASSDAVHLGHVRCLRKSLAGKAVDFRVAHVWESEEQEVSSYVGQAFTEPVLAKDVVTYGLAESGVSPEQVFRSERILLR